MNRPLARLVLSLLVVAALGPADALAQAPRPGPVFRPPAHGPRTPPIFRPPPRGPRPAPGVCQACFEPVDFAAPPPPQGSCYLLPAALDGGADCDWVSIPVVADKRYLMTFCHPAGRADQDVVLRLYDSACGLLTANDDSCAGGLSEIVWDAGADDVWRLQIANANVNLPDPTNYEICIMELGDACDSCTDPGPATLFPAAACQYQAGSTQPTAACSVDYYNVFLERGAAYRFSTCPAPLPAPPDPTCPGANRQGGEPGCDPAQAWNPRIEIYSMASCVPGSELTPGVLGSGGCAADPLAPDFVYTHAGATGLHVLAIGLENPVGNPALCMNHGSYTLAYQRLTSGCASCSAGPYVNGMVPLVPTPACQTVGGAIDSCNDEWLEFDLGAGTSYEFTTCSDPAGCQGGLAVPVTRLELFAAPSCALLAMTGVADFCSATGPRLVVTPPVSGAFRLRVAGIAGQIGPYMLTYRELP